MKALRLGTRGSDLALWQANHVKALLEAAWPGLEVEIVEIRTGGDRDRKSPLWQSKGIGFFTKEIEQALLDGEVDVAVHSLKDLPTVLAPGLALAAVPEREDTRDALIGRPGRVEGLADLEPGMRVGTSSPRRQGQLLASFPGLRVESIRGNVATRIAKTREEGGPDATLLAMAGLLRLGLAGEVAEAIPHETMLPAVGQGALGLEIRGDDEEARERLSAIEHGPTRTAVTAERAFLRRLEGGCTIPAGAFAHNGEGGAIVLEGALASPDGTEVYRDRRSGPSAEAETVGRALAEALLGAGGGELLARLRREEP
jgi:hydroxymethylbilane synthase